MLIFVIQSSVNSIYTTRANVIIAINYRTGHYCAAMFDNFVENIYCYAATDQ